MVHNNLKRRIIRYQRSHPEIVSIRLTGKTPQKYRLVVVEKLNNHEEEYVVLGYQNIQEFLYETDSQPHSRTITQSLRDTI